MNANNITEAIGEVFGKSYDNIQEGLYDALKTLKDNGGGGADFFEIDYRVEPDGGEDYVFCDITYEEILAAKQAGKKLVANVNDMGRSKSFVLFDISKSSSSFTFGMVSGTTLVSLTHPSSNTIVYTLKDITPESNTKKLIITDHYDEEAEEYTLSANMTLAEIKSVLSDQKTVLDIVMYNDVFDAYLGCTLIGYINMSEFDEDSGTLFIQQNANGTTMPPTPTYITCANDVWSRIEES